MTQIFLFALLGAVFYWISKSYSSYQSQEYTPKQFQNFVISKESLAKSELGLFVALVAKVAKADGRIDELEAELVGNMFSDISSLFPDPLKTKNILKEIFAIEKQTPHNVDQIASQLYTLLKNDPQKRQKMMEFMINLAYIDGTLTHSEEGMLYKIGAFLHLNNDTIIAMIEQFGSLYKHAHKESSLSSAYTLLGIESDASDDEVKKAYRALVKQHHPDIIKSQGGSEEYLKEATVKVQEINAAYEMIKKSRGI